MTRPAAARVASPARAVSHARLLAPARAAAAAVLIAAGVGAPAPSAAQQVRLRINGVDQQLPDAAGGRENSEFVFVRDSAAAQEKFALAQKMERLKEWDKSADLYQEVLEKFRDRVIPDGKNAAGVIDRYTSVTWGVLRQLAKWPPEGLDVYRARYEPRAAALVAKATGDDVGPLHEAFAKFFVTESGKRAGIRLIDAALERGEYAAAAEAGDQLLTTYPKAHLIAERPGVLFRTALAHRLAGDPESRKRADERAATLAADFPKEMGVIRGKDVVLADALRAELAAAAADEAAGG
ncbi:MAG: hypothetical protein JWO31_2043, partial [Phycisphaerales bacterium]|nr:hypothetical protein [Phycisphaerales bacterium]